MLKIAELLELLTTFSNLVSGSTLTFQGRNLITTGNNVCTNYINKTVIYTHIDSILVNLVEFW